MKQEFISIEKELSKNLFNDNMRTFGLNKPIGGVWASSYTPNKEYVSEWHNFLVNEMDKNPSFGTVFKLKKDAKVYQIHTLEDLIKLPFKKSTWREELDFNKIKTLYDGIYLSSEGQWNTRLTQPYNLYGWDVETLLILNYDCIDDKSIKTIKI